MELKYIWIDDYTVLERIGVNFNHIGAHQFEYDGSDLNLKTNNRPPLTFEKNVSSVTIIAGQNGSGKSSLCEAILFSTATYNGKSFGFDKLFKGIVCYDDHIFIYEKLALKNSQKLEENGYKIIKFKESPFEEMKPEWRNSFAKGAFIYYSNTLDFRSDVQHTNLANISTLNSLNKSYYYSTSHPRLSRYTEEARENADKDKHGPLQIHYNVEGNRIVKFYLENYHIAEFIEIRHFVLKCTYIGNNRFLDIDKIERRFDHESNANADKLREILNRIFTEIFDKKQQIDQDLRVKIDKDKFKSAIKKLYRYNLLISLSVAKKEIPDAEVVFDFVFNSKTADPANQKEFAQLVKTYDLIVDKSLVLDQDEFNPSSLSKYFEDVKDWRFYLIENFYIENNEENRALVSKLLTFEKNLLTKDRHYYRVTNFNVTPLSSGENSMLTFFSRIDDALARYDTGVYNKKHLILFIDEAEIGFHPEWKRKYFNKLLKFLAAHLSRYKFQVIITTHSPYLLSDVPSENVVLLRREPGEKTKLFDSSQFKTFGSNINDLLATSFFLGEGLIGEFAQEKIQNLIDNLREDGHVENFIPMTKIEIKKMISLLGEPFLQEKLMEMFYQKFPDEFQNDQARKNRIKELENELTRLKNDENQS